MTLHHSTLVRASAAVAVAFAAAAAFAGPASATSSHQTMATAHVVTHAVNHPTSLTRPFVKPNSTSSNWSGYAVSGGAYTSVSASWVQPAGTCTSQNTYASFWIGIDGDGSNSVEQTGSEVDCRGGHPVYYAWYEMYPKYPKNFSNPVAPGDVFTSTVSVSGGRFTLVLSDTTQGWTKTTSKKSKKAKLFSAEVIAEAPSSGSGVLPLTNFGTMQFTASKANGSSMSSQSPDEITMESGGTVKAQPSSMDSSGDFSDTWHHV